MTTAVDTTIDRKLTPEQAAEYLGVKVQTLSAWRFHGRYDLPYVRVGRAIRYRQSDIEAWLTSRTVTPNVLTH